MSRLWVELALLALVTSCVESQSVFCANGRVCSADRVCDDVHDTCVLPEQLTSCTGLAEAAPCAIGGELVGVCFDDVCLDVACGDGVISGLEQCEPGALDIDDCTQLGYYDAGPVTCSAGCRYDVSACERRCGDGIVDPEEQCDGDQAADDCTAHGFYQSGPVACTSCLFDTAACVGRCGDGMRNGDEVCDGSDPPLLGCIDLGFERGVIGCQSCAADVDECGRIGWASLGSVGSTQWLGAASTRPGHVVAVGSGGAIVEITDGQQVSDTLASAGVLHDVWAASVDDMFVVDDLGGIWRGKPGSWMSSRAQVTTSDSLHALAGTAVADLWAVGDKARILRFDGNTWSEVHIGTAILEDLWIGAGGTGLAVGANGTILRRSGSSWVAETSNTTARLTSVWSDGAIAFAVGAAGTILRHDGTSWTAMPSGVTTDLLDVFGRNPRDLYAVGASGVILHFDGASWWRVESGVTASLSAVTGNARETFAAGALGTVVSHEASWSLAVPNGFIADLSLGNDGTIVASAAGSSCAMYRRGPAAWTSVATTCSAFQGWDDVWIAPNGMIFAGDANGAVHRHDGTSWTVHADAVTNGVRALWGSSATDVWAADWTGNVAHWNGTVWSPVAIDASGIYGIHGTSANDVYAVGGDILHWDGNTWTDVAPPGVFGSWNGVWAAAPNNVWVVGSDGQILHFDGVSWTVSPSGTVASLTAVGGTAADDVWAVGASGTILHFDGVRWSPVKSPIAASYYDVAVRDDLVVIAAWYEGIVTLVREAGAW